MLHLTSLILMYLLNYKLLNRSCCCAKAVPGLLHLRSRCNEKYWKRTDNGGFQLLPTVSPHQAIDDIFYNGHEYAFECATAVIIIFYKAVLNNIGKANFNRLFADLYLHDWQYDEDLELHGYKGSDYLPGDCAYFKNPDYNPDTPQWKGENTIVLDETLYFGHGIGITTRERIIEVLNLKRKRRRKAISLPVR